MKASPLISVVLASSNPLLTAKASEAYKRETANLELVVVSGSLDGAWASGCSQTHGFYVHFASDLLEPHPGWWQAGASAVLARRIPAPTLFTPDGDGPLPTDWTAATGSAYPMLSREQVDLLGPPPFASDMLERFAGRTEYAFTLWK